MRLKPGQTREERLAEIREAKKARKERLHQMGFKTSKEMLQEAKHKTSSKYDAAYWKERTPIYIERYRRTLRDAEQVEGQKQEGK